MPKKTRKEKMLAQQRKELRRPQVNTPPELSDEKKQVVNYFIIDLKKSLILIAIIIALEFSLYFATINHYLKF